MDYKEIISQLQDLKKNSESFLDKNEPDSVWNNDIKALDEAMDIINDYSAMAKQYRASVTRYETAKDVIRCGMGTYQCPDCRNRVFFGNEHCRRCGRKLGWHQHDGRQRQGKDVRKKAESQNETIDCPKCGQHAMTGRRAKNNGHFHGVCAGCGAKVIG